MGRRIERRFANIDVYLDICQAYFGIPIIDAAIKQFSRKLHKDFNFDDPIH